MLEPVQQGILTPSTRIIISTTPHTTSNQINSDDDGEVSVRGSTHISLADFDADAFLSSSLAISLSKPPASPNGSPNLDTSELGQSISSDGSGEITPRPPGSRLSMPSSPAAGLQDLLAESEPSGTRFATMGPSSNANQSSDACWIGIGGLGRAGVFEGDWVSQSQPRLLSTESVSIAGIVEAGRQVGSRCRRWTACTRMGLGTTGRAK